MMIRIMITVLLIFCTLLQPSVLLWVWTVGSEAFRVVVLLSIFFHVAGIRAAIVVLGIRRYGRRRTLQTASRGDRRMMVLMMRGGARSGSGGGGGRTVVLFKEMRDGDPAVVLHLHLGCSSSRGMSPPMLLGQRWCRRSPPRRSRRHDHRHRHRLAVRALLLGGGEVILGVLMLLLRDDGGRPLRIIGAIEVGSDVLGDLAAAAGICKRLRRLLGRGLGFVAVVVIPVDIDIGGDIATNIGSGGVIGGTGIFSSRRIPSRCRSGLVVGRIIASAVRPGGMSVTRNISTTVSVSMSTMRSIISTVMVQILLLDRFARRSGLPGSTDDGTSRRRRREGDWKRSRRGRSLYRYLCGVLFGGHGGGTSTLYSSSCSVESRCRYLHRKGCALY
mmetsp:Transcript_39493/g.86666  ORF Transcript_39493/g.86666 Transcript_39493/m.86666 type:complete len:388 (+) Transcript_39493:1912-3075(+)